MVLAYPFRHENFFRVEPNVITITWAMIDKLQGDIKITVYHYTSQLSPCHL